MKSPLKEEIVSEGNADSSLVEEPGVFDLDFDVEDNSPNKIPPSQIPSQKCDTNSDSSSEDDLAEFIGAKKAARALFSKTKISGCTFNLTFNYK